MFAAAGFRLTACLAGLVVLVAVATFAREANAVVDDDAEHIVVKADGTGLTPEGRMWVRDFDAAAETRWRAGPASEYDLFRFKQLLTGRFIPAAGRIMPVQAGNIAKAEVCSAEIHAGCWYYERDDRGVTSGSVGGHTLSWTYQEAATPSDGAYFGFHFEGLQNQRDIFHATWDGCCGYVVMFTDDMSPGCSPSFSWTLAGPAARHAVATEADTCWIPPPPYPDGTLAPAKRGTVWYPGRAHVLRPQADDPSIRNVAGAPEYSNWAQTVAAELLRPENKPVRDWIATDIVARRPPPPPLQTGTTIVRGDKATNAPLEIDPKASQTDPLTTDVWTNTTVQWIRMPITKSVQAITLGDFALPSSCTQSTRVYLNIDEYPDGSHEGAGQRLAYTDPATVTTTPGQLTFRLRNNGRLTLRKGRGYAFVLGGWNGCWHLRQTTWSHNFGQVDPGATRCAGGPYIGSDGGGGFLRKRMYHQQGMDDAQIGCVDGSVSARRFDPSMPSGWSAVSGQTGYRDVMTTSTIFETRDDVCKSEQPQPLGAGAKPVHWRDGPYPKEDFVCQWTQFAPAGSTVADGWYYALPWPRARDGQPRDAYVRLDTIDYDFELAAHAPILKYDSDEAFEAQPPSSLTDHWRLSNAGDWDPGVSNKLKDGYSDPDTAWTLAIAGAPDGYAPELSLGTLGKTYSFGGTASANHFVDAYGSTFDEYYADSKYERLRGKDNVMYGRAVHGRDGELWLQYWLFYYYNNFEAEPVDDFHEGDWEMVQIRLNSELTPDRMTYARHGYKASCTWSEAPHDSYDHPWVYVASQSHASYKTSGVSRIEGVPIPVYDLHWGQNERLVPLQVIRETTPWVEWPGHWGSSTFPKMTSPRGPAYQGQWNPTEFDERAGGCS